MCFHSISFKFVGGNALRSDVFFVVCVYPEVVDSVPIVTHASGASSTLLSSLSLRGVGASRARLLSHILRCFRTSEGFADASRTVVVSHAEKSPKFRGLLYQGHPWASLGYPVARGRLNGHVFAFSQFEFNPHTKCVNNCDVCREVFGVVHGPRDGVALFTRNRAPCVFGWDFVLSFGCGNVIARVLLGGDPSVLFVVGSEAQSSLGPVRLIVCASLLLMMMRRPTFRSGFR